MHQCGFYTSVILINGGRFTVKVDRYSWLSVLMRVILGGVALKALNCFWKRFNLTCVITSVWYVRGVVTRLSSEGLISSAAFSVPVKDSDNCDQEALWIKHCRQNDARCFTSCHPSIFSYPPFLSIQGHWGCWSLSHSHTLTTRGESPISLFFHIHTHPGRTCRPDSDAELFCTFFLV